MSPNVVPMFADRRIIEDETERAMHRLIDCAADFGHALTDAETPGRCVQVAERIGVAMALLAEVQNAALHKADRL